MLIYFDTDTQNKHSQSDEHWNRFKGNVWETSERRGGAHMGFSEHAQTSLNRIELTHAELVCKKTIYLPQHQHPTHHPTHPLPTPTQTATQTHRNHIVYAWLTHGDHFVYALLTHRDHCVRITNTWRPLCVRVTDWILCFLEGSLNFFVSFVSWVIGGGARHFGRLKAGEKKVAFS